MMAFPYRYTFYFFYFSRIEEDRIGHFGPNFHLNLGTKKIKISLLKAYHTLFNLFFQHG
jgi:hypothetical protein